MRLYLLTSLGQIDYDEYYSFVIAASDITEARGLADQGAAYSQKEHFLDKTLTSCQYLGKAAYAVPRGIICFHCNYG